MPVTGSGMTTGLDVYSPENISKMTGQYADTLEPQYARSRAQIAQTLGGRGSLYGTPGSNKLQLLENERMSDIGKYTAGLQGQGMGAAYTAGAPITPYQQSQLDVTGAQQEAERTKNYFNMLSTLMGAGGVGSALSSIDWGSLFGGGNPLDSTSGTEAPAYDPATGVFS